MCGRSVPPRPRLHSFTLLPLSFALLQKSKIYLPSFQPFAHSLPKTTGVYPNYSLPRRLSPRGQSGTRRSFLPRATCAGSALFCSFFHSSAVRGNSSLYFSTASALFPKTPGCTPTISCVRRSRNPFPRPSHPPLPALSAFARSETPNGQRQTTNRQRPTPPRSPPSRFRTFPRLKTVD